MPAEEKELNFVELYFEFKDLLEETQIDLEYLEKEDQLIDPIMKYTVRDAATWDRTINYDNFKTSP